MTADDGLQILIFLLLGFIMLWAIISAISSVLAEDGKILAAESAEKVCPPHKWTDVPLPTYNGEPAKTYMWCPLCKRTPSMVAASIRSDKPY